MLPDKVIPANVKWAANIRFMYNKAFYTDSQYAICLSYSSKYTFKVYIGFLHSSKYVFKVYSRSLWSVIKEHEKAIFKGLLYFSRSLISTVYLKFLVYVTIRFWWGDAVSTLHRELNGVIGLEIGNCETRDALFSIVPQNWVRKKYLLNFQFSIFFGTYQRICWIENSTNNFSSSYAFLFSLWAVHKMLWKCCICSNCYFVLFPFFEYEKAENATSPTADFKFAEPFFSSFLNFRGFLVDFTYGWCHFFHFHSL